MSDGPNIFTIPASHSHVEVLAKGLLDQYGDDPLAISKVLIFLPTRRAARTLREAFLRQSGGKALLLPRILPLGDVDDDDPALAGVLPGAQGEALPPAINTLERNLLLSHLVQAWHRRTGEEGDTLDSDQSYRLAAELGRLLDQLQTEQIPLQHLGDLVSEEFADHWQITLEFLKIIGDEWQGVLQSRGVMDPVDRRNRLIHALAEHWRTNPPQGPVIAAGSTGSIPATAELLKTIAHLPQGQVILPGFQLDMDADSWSHLDPSHPQAGMQLLLERMGTDRENVSLWPILNGDADKTANARASLLCEAMRPAATTSQWEQIDRSTLPQAVAGLSRIDAGSTREEADSIALVMRETLETPGKTASLITPDRELARRTAAALRRWDIDIDDSAGLPLSNTVEANFMQLIAEMCLDNFAPVPVLAALKHPLSAQGQFVGEFRHLARRLEYTVLRGPRPGPGRQGISDALTHKQVDEDLSQWWQDMSAICTPLADLFAQESLPLVTLVTAHVTLAENLAATDEVNGADRLWKGQAGEALARFFENLMQQGDLLGEISPRSYPALIGTMLFEQAVRPQWGKHPRLSILGPLEARLHHADVIILGGLNEGTWPPDVGSDPWLSRPMKAQLNLPQPERRIGLSAHDFVHGASSGQVYLSRATRSGGAPTMPSRWLLRLDAITEKDMWHRPPHVGWAASLDEAPVVPPVAPPAPTPAVALRPTQLSATQIETWMRDPYAIYARKILRLDALPPLDEEPGAREQGTFIHEALEKYLKTHPGAPPEGALDVLLGFGHEAFGDIKFRPSVYGFWWPRFIQIAEWFIDQQTARQDIATPTIIEGQGTLTIDAGTGQTFTITAVADRIDRLADGTYDIIDYKTGAPPTVRRVNSGYAPQLPIEAMILEAGGFPGITDATTGDLSFWQLRGGTQSSRIDAFTKRKNQKNLPTLIEEAAVGLRQLVTAFAIEDTPYLSHPNPSERGWGDYDHLARVKEWEATRRDD